MTTSTFVPVPAAGISDHGDLAGLADDDHALYLTTAEGNAAYDVAGAAAAAQAAAVQRDNHIGTQAESTVTNLVSDLAAKADLVAGTVPSAQLPAVEQLRTLIDSVVLSALIARLDQSATAVDAPFRGMAVSNITLTSGSQYVSYFAPLRDLTVSKIAMSSSTAPLTSGGTLIRMGLFTAAADDALTLVARTASDTALFAGASTVYERSFDTGGGFPASYTLLRGVRYAAGVIAVSTVTPAIVAESSPSQLTALPPRRSATRAGLSDLADTTAAQLVNLARVPWVRLSA